MTSEDKCYALFPSTYWALRGDKLLAEADMDVKLRPVPRELSSSCGICLEFSCGDARGVARALEDLGVDNDGLFSRTGARHTAAAGDGEDQRS